MTPSAGGPPLRLLALDGGGIRGLSELLLLKAVMHRLMIEENKKRIIDSQPPLIHLPKPCDYFDLIGGTSTGGIIAIMLGRLRMDVHTAIDRYVYLARQVFSDMKLWGDEKFKASKLEEALKSLVEGVTGDSESSLLVDDEPGVCRTFVCAMNTLNMNARIPTLFRTYQAREIPLNCKIWEAARATSAAPTFFKPMMIGRKQPFIDGGLGNNNPSRLLLDEAKELFGARQIGCLVSIGTGQPDIISMQNPGAFQRVAMPMDVINALNAMATDCEATHETMLGLFGNLSNTYFRLNVEQGMQRIEFSEWDKLANVEAHTRQYLKRKEVDKKLGLLVNAIRFPRGYLTIEQIISPRPPVEVTRRVKERKLCPLPVASFTGRKEILDRMHQYFDSDVDFQRVFVVYGLGGSGKSQIALKFLQECQAKQRFSDIFYIDATNRQTLEMDLGAINDGNLEEESVKAILRWLTNKRDGQWLLFFDNADDVDLKLKEFIPLCAFGNILVTTRNPELRLLAGKGQGENVTGMDHEDAENLLLKLSRADDTEENRALAAQIVQELHHLALAVSQAGAFIYCHSSLLNYRELYQRERDNLLQNREAQDPDPYESAVYATWRLSYDKLDTAARTLLQICSVLHHEGISEEIFEKAASSQLELEDSEVQNKVMQMLNQLGKRDSGWSSWDFLRVIKNLVSYSLIEYDHRNCTYSLHPLVKHWSGTTTGNDRHLIKKCVLSIIGLSISRTFNMEDYKYRSTLLKHITNESALSLNPTELDSLVASHLVLVYSERGLWKDAEVLQLVVTEKMRQTLGDEHPDSLDGMGRLATIYGDQGRWKDAEVLDVAVIEKRKQVLGDDHPDTLGSIGNLAATYMNQGRWKDAEVLLVVVLEKSKQVLGDDHPHTLTSMGNLAFTYLNQGRWKDAEALEMVAMEKRKQVLGDDHPDTLMSMGNLALTYMNQGRWKDAEALLVVVIEKSKQVLGDDHPHTLTNMGNLAVTYRDRGRWKDAEELEVVVLEKRKQVLGDDHPHTLGSIEHLAATYGNQGRWKDAEVLLVVVIEKSKQVRGDDHPHTLASMGNLALTYRDQDRWKDAEVLQVVVMEKTKQVLGGDHPDTLRCIGHLATTYVRQGRWKDAEALQVVVMEKTKQLLGDDHPDTLMNMGNLAYTYSNQGRLKDAEELEVLVLEKMKQLLGDDHPDTLRSIGNLAFTYSNQGRWKDAEVLQVQVMEKMKQILGDDHPNTIWSIANLAATFSNLGRSQDAEALEVLTERMRAQN